MDAAVDAKVRASFAQQTMMASLGAEIADLSAGLVTLTAPVWDGFKQQQGFAHAGVTFALGDSAAGYAALTVMPLEMEVMTAEMKINLLAPGHGTLTAEGRVLKAGRRLIVVAADVYAQAGTDPRTHIAALQGTMVPVKV